MKNLITLFLLIFLFTSCKKELTVEQSKLKVTFDEQLEELNQDAAAITICLTDLIKQISNYYKITDNKTEPKSMIETMLEGASNRIVTQIIYYNKLVDIFERHMGNAERSRKILEGTGITVEYSKYSFEVKDFTKITNRNDDFEKVFDRSIKGDLKRFISLTDSVSTFSFRDKIKDNRFRDIFKKNVLSQVY